MLNKIGITVSTFIAFFFFSWETFALDCNYNSLPQQIASSYYEESLQASCFSFDTPIYSMSIPLSWDSVYTWSLWYFQKAFGERNVVDIEIFKAEWDKFILLNKTSKSRAAKELQNGAWKYISSMFNVWSAIKFNQIRDFQFRKPLSAKTYKRWTLLLMPVSRTDYESNENLWFMYVFVDEFDVMYILSTQVAQAWSSVERKYLKQYTSKLWNTTSFNQKKYEKDIRSQFISWKFKFPETQKTYNEFMEAVYERN